jgi:hypothetical protein
MERRTIAAHELRASTTGMQQKISGYASTFNQLSSIIGGEASYGFREKIQPGAFRGVLASNPDTICSINHNPSFILGRTTSGTLRLSEDSRGLKFDCDLPNTSYARDLHESIKRGDLGECSFAFALGPGDDSWDETDDEETRKRSIVRTIRNITRLDDVSVVTRPAYPNTTVSARNVVSAEVRSIVESFKAKHRPGVKFPGGAARHAALCAYWGVTNEVSYEQVLGMIARRRKLLSEL